MKLALVTTAPSVVSGIGDYTRHLLPHLAAHCDVTVYTAPGTEGESLAGFETRSAEHLIPREHDRVLYQVGNELAHAFMPRLVRRFGGVVALHDWVLFDLALATYPALARGGPKGALLALREGGPEQLATWLDAWRARRRGRREPVLPPRPAEVEPGEGAFLSGWHAPEDDGRWTADRAWLALPAGARRVRLTARAEPERSLSLSDGAREAARAGSGALELELAAGAGPAVVALETRPVEVTAAQRRAGDLRRLGAFVSSVRVTTDAGERELDLGEPARRPLRTPHLADERFRLPLNRSLVRFGDAYVVHSAHVERLVLAERNARTPVLVVPHGAEPRWRDDDRRAERDALGLDPSWRDAFLVTSFGSVQAHKRPHVLLHALARVALERPPGARDVRLVFVGGFDREFDVRALVRAAGVEDRVHFTGRAPEAEAWRWIHAGDLAVQLRGPSTGGSSGGLFQSLALGRAAIASELAEQAELPEDCVLRVAPGEGEVAALATSLAALRDDPERLAALEAAARDYVRETCRWELVGEHYARFLGRCPRARNARKRFYSIQMRRELAQRETR